MATYPQRAAAAPPVSPPYLQISGSQEVYYLFKSGEGFENWTEIWAQGNFSGSTPAAQLTAWTPAFTTYKQCPKTAKTMAGTEISSSRTMYQIHIIGCPSLPDYTETGLIVRGSLNAWLTIYGVKQAALSPAQQAEVMSDFNATVIVDK